MSKRAVWIGVAIRFDDGSSHGYEFPTGGTVAFGAPMNPEAYDPDPAKRFTAPHSAITVTGPMHVHWDAGQQEAQRHQRRIGKEIES